MVSRTEPLISLSRRSHRAVAPIVVVIAALMALAVASPAMAHADLASTSPSDKDVVTEPVERIELVFTDTVETTGSGVRLLDGNGGTVGSSVFSASDTTVAVIPDEPLSAGRYAVLWEVESADGHEIPGSISFEVALPDTGETDSEGTDDQPTGAAEDATTTADTPPTTLSSTPTTVVITHSPASVAASTAQDATVGEDPNTALADIMGFVGRWATLLGALLAIGALAFASTSLVGSRSEVRQSVRWIRRGATLVLAGTLVEVSGGILVDLAGGEDLVTAIIDLLASSFGISVVLRLAGGAALLMDPEVITMSPIGVVQAEGTGEGPSIDEGPRTGETIASRDGSAVATRAPTAPQTYQLDIRPEWVALAGLTAVVASFMFDGHTVTAEPDLVARVAAAIHVIAGGVWLGGLVVMADTLVRRNRVGSSLDAASMGLRFSRVATAAVLAVGVAGLALTWTIVDDPADIVSTTWGRLLLMKVALVVVAAAIGAYNHFVIVPRLDDAATGADHQTTLRRTVSIEAALLVAVVVVTAALVVAAA